MSLMGVIMIKYDKFYDVYGAGISIIDGEEWHVREEHRRFSQEKDALTYKKELEKKYKRVDIKEIKIRAN